MAKANPPLQRGAGSRIFSAAHVIFAVFCFWFILPDAQARAQDPSVAPPAKIEDAATDSHGPVQLDAVLVTAARIPSEASRVPAAVSTVTNDEFQQGRTAVKLDDALVRVPGVLVQNETNFAQDLRISIRGFGARSAFGIRGIQVYVDGIPHTLPDGQSALDTIDPESISQLEVLRGPVSALYGNASGGVINIITQEGPPEPFVEHRTVIGDYGLWKKVLKGGGQAGRLNYFAAVSHLDIEGYRDHSQVESTIFNSKLRYDVDDYSELSMILNAARTPEAQDPGGLTLAQAADDPTQAAPLNRQYDTGESISDQRIGLVYRRAIFSNQNLEVAGFYNQRDLDNAIPFRFIDLQRKTAGGRIQHDLSGTLLGRSHRLVSGIERHYQFDDRLNYNNISGAPGDTLLLYQDETVIATGLYLQEELDLSSRLSILLGGRYDHVRFEIDDRLPDETNDSGTRTFDQFTGRVGLMYALRPTIRLYGNIAQSFETPTTTEVVNRPAGGGGINPQIEPQTAVNYEIGMKTALGQDFSLDVALFLIQLEDELIAFRDATDRVFYRNAGQSQRKGAELELTKRFLTQWQLSLAYTYMTAEFETYVKDGRDLDGNHVPGLPEHQLFAELRYAHATGLYAAGNLRYTGALFVDDENTLRTEAATVVDARLGYEAQFNRWQIEPFFGIRNALNETYNSNVRINANGDRYFEPAPERNYYGGFKISYQW
jgi:iron complex outermembrane recepter protein